MDKLKPYPPMTVPGHLLPWFVVFSDRNAPLSVKKIVPGEFSQVFGAGYKFKKLTVEEVDEKFRETGIKKVLPWLDRFSRAGMLERASSMDTAKNFDAFRLNRGSFVGYP